MSRRNFHKLAAPAAATALSLLALSVGAQVSQKPLLSSASPVTPNIMFMLDDSSSMPGDAIYQYGGSEGVYGMSGPGGSGSSLTSNTYASQSPDVNLIYYDPRVTYKRRVNADGSQMAAGDASAVSSWRVYFYGRAGTFNVQTISLDGDGGIYSTQPASNSFQFPAAPSGGTTATATITTAASKRVTGVNVTNGGNYNSCPTTGQVSLTGATPSGTGAVAATVTGVNCQTFTNGVQDVTENNSLTFPGSCTSPTVTLRNSGTGADISVTLGTSGSNKIVQSFTVNNPGSGFTSNTNSIRVSCAGTNRDYNITRTSGTRYRVNSVAVSAANFGYSSAPSVSFPTGSPQTAVGTATIADAWRIATVTRVNTGAKYTTQPVFSTMPAAITPAAFTYTYGNDPGTNVVNMRWDGTGTAQYATDFFTTTPAGFSFAGYLPDAGSPLAAGATLLAYPNQPSSSVTQYPKFINRSDCAAATHCTWAEERQNYANWDKYHSNRLEIAKTGIGLAFQPMAVASGQAQFRLGWATINRLNSLSQVDKGVRDYTTSVRNEFFTWLYQDPRTLTAGTPNKNALHQVGRYFSRGDNSGPWANTPDGNSVSVTGGAAVATHASCRRSYALLMTDGYYNDTSAPSPGDVDSNNKTVTTSPSTYAYAPIGPYSDKRTGSGISNTFADVAMNYYMSDLRPDLNNNVRPVPGDEAFWQHLNFYAIGLGVNGTLDATNPATLASLTGSSPARTRDWPTPSSNSRTSIDDMWHATINGRGRMLSAKTSDELSDAISKMISDISGKEGTQAGVAVSTASLTRGSKKYTPSYTPVSWQGNLTAYKLNQTNANQLADPAWMVETPITGTNPQQYTSTIGDEASRRIVGGNGAATGARAVNFTHTDLGATLRAQIGSTTVVTDDFIKYLRGDKTNEGTLYRSRSTKLGDIINSTPVYVKDSLDMKYDTLPSTVPGQSDYAAFRTLKKGRAEGVIFVGANDGMVHAFRDGTYDADGATLTPGGAEVFAYVPYAVYPALPDLASKTYTHRYYVDGPMVEADAYVGGGWKNLVLGTTGAGAGVAAVSGTGPRASVFALDVTKLNTPTTGITSLGAGDVLWEVGPWMSAYDELGHVLNDVQAGVTVSGDWVAIYGNGYGSKSCKAQLFISSLADGSLIRKMDTGVGSGACNSSANANANGMGGVRLVLNDKQQIVGAYAGDLQGNVWRIDMSTAASSGWTMTKLFATGTANQPITAPPSVLNLPMVGTTKPAPGYMVIFGTGKFYEDNDVNTTNQQALYGVYDPSLFGTAATPTLTGVSSLQAQAISATAQVSNGNTYYSVSNTTVSYDGAGAKRGWYLPLTNSNKQRIIYPMEILARRFIAADTMSPEGVPTDPCSTEFGGVGYLYILDALNGGGPTEAVLDTNGDGNVNSADLVVAGVQGEADGRNVSLLVSADASATTYANVSGGSPGATLIKISCALTGTCPPVSGGTYQRQWRQLFLR